MIVINTRTVPATDTKGTRVIAQFADTGWTRRRHEQPWNYAESDTENHVAAAKALYAREGRRPADYVGGGDAGRAKQVHLFQISY